MQRMNKPIEIGGVPVCNDDVVFADEDGVVVVPRSRWSAVEARAWEVLESEAQIRLNAARGLDTSEILNRFGTF